MTPEQMLEVWRRACLIHHFELAVCRAADAGHIKCPIYSSLGQEFIPATVSLLCDGMPLFAQHRCHGWFLAWGGDMGQLIDELLGRETGCAHGMGGSASIHIPGKMFAHDGLMGSQAPIAAGYALATGKPVVCVLGDGSSEEDYVLSTIGWIATKKLPVLIIVENNDLSILTHVAERRSWRIRDVASGMGIKSGNTEDSPPWISSVHDMIAKPLPALLEIECCRWRWHCGTGTDREPEWDRRKMFATELVKRSVGTDAAIINDECLKLVEDAWAKALPK